MRRIFMVSLLAISVCFLGAVFFARGASTEQSGAALFKEHCAVCHPDGGNIINPQKPLQQKEREANGVKTAEDIVKKMRKPGPGMTSFDEKTIPDADAKKIAEYILKTFK